MSTRKISSINSLEEFSFSPKVKQYLGTALGLTAQRVIELTRRGELAFTGLDKDTIEGIEKSIDIAGFLFHETPISQCYRDLVVEILKPKDFGETDEYERRTELSSYRRASILRIISELLGRNEKNILMDLFGLRDGRPISPERCAKNRFLSESLIIRIKETAIRKITRRRETMKMLKTIYDFSESELGYRIQNLSNDAKQLERDESVIKLRAIEKELSELALYHPYANPSLLD